MPAHRIVASAPGSLMLLGEHAVVRGRLCLVGAVAQRIRVTLTPRADREVAISSALGSFRGTLDALPDTRETRFVAAAIRAQKPATGFDLVVDADFPPTIGFGSSAAVTVATVAVLARLHRRDESRGAILDASIRVIREVQGMGSGADVAASTVGGIVLYRAEPREVEVLPHTHPFVAVYSGSKLPTPQVVALVAARREEHPRIYDGLFDTIDQCVMNAADAVRMKDWPELGRLMNINHGLMDAMGVCNAALARIVYALREAPGILGSKISGSGLGDCAIGLGSIAANAFPDPVLPVSIDTKGVVVEEA